MTAQSNAVVPLYKPGDDITGKCTGVVTGKKFIKISAAHPGRGLQSTAAGNTIGIIQATVAGARNFGVAGWDGVLGDFVTVHRSGAVVPVVSGAAVTAGVEVECSADGRVIALNTGRAVGIAMSTVGAADLDVFVSLY